MKSFAAERESAIVPLVGFVMMLAVGGGVLWVVVSGVRWLWNHPLF